uniref:MIP05682p n=1 Tax=Drosophila melanogaster TaxID=7227 RepID=C1C3H3_DROME|nr:MIP05682p [Drosophila melanogaster]
MNKCPRCNCDATGQNRLVTDSCGHTKCRLCLVADVSDCLECRVARSVDIQETQETQARTSADKRIIVTDKGYHCTVCNKDFRSRTQQYYHLTCGNDLLKKFNCKECGRRFATSSHLKYHLMSHEKQSKHSCSVCHKSFKQPIVLQRHMLTHNQEKHLCPICQKVFRRKSSLASHLAIHSDLGLQFKCELCSKHFQNKANLNQHLRKHDKNNIRHMCKVCQKSFLRQTTLRLHMKRHSNRERQSCSLCGKSYNDPDALGRHLRQHKTAERYRCIQCDITINRKDNMLRHLRSMHPGCSFASTVEMVTPRSSAQEATTAEERPSQTVRYNSVIQSVGNVEPVMLLQSTPLPSQLPELQMEKGKAVPEHLPLPDVMPEENVQLYRKIILDLDNEEYSSEPSPDAQEPAMQHHQPRVPGQGSSKFSEMYWRKNFKYWYQKEENTK